MHTKAFSSNGKIGIVGNCGIHLVEKVEMKTKPRNNLSALKPPFRESPTADLFNLQAFFADNMNPQKPNETGFFVDEFVR